MFSFLNTWPLRRPLPAKVRIIKAMVFLVVMYECESWTIKKAEYRRINAFELWYWRRLLGVPWTTRRSNQSILKEINLNIHWRRQHFKTTIFLIYGQLMMYPLIFHISHLLQMLSNFRTVNIEFLCNFSCNWKRISSNDGSQLVVVNF